MLFVHSSTPRQGKGWQWIVGVVLIAGCCFWVLVSYVFLRPSRQSTAQPDITSEAFPSTPAPVSVKPTPSSTITTGTEGVIYGGSEGGVLVGRDEPSYSELNRAANAKDQYGMSQLMLAGRVFILSSGTRVLVIDAGFFSHTIRVLEGTHRGRSAIIATEFVRLRS